MSDVTAVVLTLGEPDTARALASLERQALAPADVVVISGVEPFSEALNLGAARVRTPFFVQVDSDMVLDRKCLAALREAMTPDVGIAVGQLRDPLMGTIAGIKLFRRACFESTRVQDSITPDVDFYYDLARLGWLTVHVLDYRGRAKHTFGAHRPRFTPAYTYATYYLLGARYWYRRDLDTFLWRLARLRRSRHRMAPTARFALAAGLFSDETRDVRKSEVPVDGLLIRQLARPLDGASEPFGLPRLAAAERCMRFWELGAELRERGGWPELRAWMASLAATPDPDAWLAEASLYAGFAAPGRGGRGGVAYERLRILVELRGSEFSPAAA